MDLVVNPPKPAGNSGLAGGNISGGPSKVSNIKGRQNQYATPRTGASYVNARDLPGPEARIDWFQYEEDLNKVRVGLSEGINRCVLNVGRRAHPKRKKKVQNPERIVLPNAGRIKKVMQNLCDRAADLAIAHVETEVGLQPKSFARKEQALFPDVDKIITDYAKNRAFWITGIAKDDILMTVKGLITDWAATHKTPYPDDLLVRDITRALSDWLPQGTNIAARAELIARVNVLDIYNYSRFQIMTAPQLQNLIEAFLYSAILDGRTTVLCRSLSGRIFTKEDLAQSGLIPPNHFRCRSILLPVTTYDKGWREVYDGQPPLQWDQQPQEGFQ